MLSYLTRWLRRSRGTESDETLSPASVSQTDTWRLPRTAPASTCPRAEFRRYLSRCRREARHVPPRAPHPLDEQSRPDAVLTALRRGDYSVLHERELASLERYMNQRDPWGEDIEYELLRRHIERAWLSGELQSD